ncbi:MAG: radical SAM protein, partial [Desulfamplus sp.]|nr:radical SAM protein [Desulfamplus sp.]
MYKYLFGPVPSRRLGISLGIDLVTHKICSLDCVYCECGKTTNLTLERKEYVSCKEVVEELEHYFANHPAPDYITFSGSGEPTLNSCIGDVIEYIKRGKQFRTLNDDNGAVSCSVAVLTNGTLLGNKAVRDALLKADLVIPSLDAASLSAFTRINRPHHEIDINNYIQGIIDFRKIYTGRMALEILILPGFNDKKNDIEALKQACYRIKPDVIQLNTLDRPGCLPTLVQEKAVKEKKRGFFYKRLPSLDLLDNTSYTSLVIGFTMLTA